MNEKGSKMCDIFDPFLGQSKIQVVGIFWIYVNFQEEMRLSCCYFRKAFFVATFRGSYFLLVKSNQKPEAKSDSSASL